MCRVRHLLLPALALAALPSLAAASDDDEIERTWKFTAGHYRYRGDDTTHHGDDVNLRWQRDDTHAWGGVYQDRNVGTQWRGGLDSSWSLCEGLSLQPSVQTASGGFLGGSATVEADAGHWYGLIGWGRTNLKPYFNLNFDPNDAVTLGGGWRGEQGRMIGTTWIADDRLHTGQRHWHLLVHWPTGDRERLSLDLLRKRGQGDTGPVQAWGWTVTYDAPAGWFLRCAHDPKQNFSAQDALRVSLGTRW